MKKKEHIQKSKIIIVRFARNRNKNKNLLTGSTGGNGFVPLIA